MAIEIPIKYERLVGTHTQGYKLLTICDFKELVPHEPELLKQALAWLGGQSLPFGECSMDDTKFLVFRTQPRADRVKLPIHDLLDSFLDIRSEADVKRFAKRYGMLWRLMTISPLQQKPLWLGTEHYEPLSYWLRMASLFRVVRQQILWLSAEPTSRLQGPPLYVVKAHRTKNLVDEQHYRRLLIPLEDNDPVFDSLEQHYSLSLSAWWYRCQGVRVRWDRRGMPRGAPSDLHTTQLQWIVQQEIESSVFLTEHSSYLEFCTDTFIREILNQIILSETRVEIGKGGYRFTNLSLLGVLANQLGALYRGKGRFVRICIFPGCNTPIKPHRRPHTKYCPRCKIKAGSKRQAAEKRRLRQEKDLAARQHM